jgi:L-alanine-DL-glutamate epimerase-like enolase superfamily enzyme
MTNAVREITLRKLRLPLIRPYRLSYRTFTEFEPIVVHARSSSGREGWGEGHISPGSSSETREGGWRFCREYSEQIVGKSAREAMEILSAAMDASKVACTAMITAMEMMENDATLSVARDVSLPLVTPFHALDTTDIENEVESLLAQGFRTVKIKVGNDVDADLSRVAAIQAAASGRAALRIDANRGYSEADGRRFASALDPSGIELFEQPCAAEDWGANARVAEVSTVPLMLDEPICGPGDIDRAGAIQGVGFCKLKLKRFGGLQRLRDALQRVRRRGMQPVLGDGLSSEINCWMEACAAIGLVGNAGEFNGFLKPAVRLFANPLSFVSGSIELPANYWPEIDRDVLKRHEIACERFAVRA